LSVPSNSLSINLKINLIVLMLPNCWFTSRRGGLARELMNELESCARQQGKTLLVLDTATGSGAELFYHNCVEKVGVIPDYAQMPDGTLTGTTLFYKTL
jgi:hypothetical protein